MIVKAVVSPSGEIQGSTITESRTTSAWSTPYDDWQVRDRFLAQEQTRFWMRFFWPSKSWTFYQQMGYKIKKFELKEVK